MRTDTKVIQIGNIKIGGDYPVVIQSMTNTKTKNIEATIHQIKELTQKGCQLVRLAVLDKEDALAISEIKKRVSVPLVADIHFDYQLAIEAVLQGIDKIRINPGNIGDENKIRKVVEICKAHHVPIRIGINSGSLEKHLLEKYHGPTTDALLESMDLAIQSIEKMNFFDLVLSIKATDLDTTLRVNKELAKRYTYPIHLGLTEAGTIQSGTILSSYVLGTLLNDGIGNTIRVSLHGDPVNEIGVAKEILSMCHLYTKPRLIVCPTCGRTEYNMTPIVKEIEEFLETISYPLTVAIMGCVVNGPGEAKEADLGIAGGKKSAVLFKKGQIMEKIPEKEITHRLKEEILYLISSSTL